MGADWCAVMATHCVFEKMRRFFPGLVSEGEGAPVDAEQMLRADVCCDLDRFGGVGVLRAHEPSGCVGSDGKYGDEWWSASGPDFGKDFAVLVCGVAGAVDAA